MSGQLYEAPNITVLAQLPEGGFGAPSEYNVGGQELTQGLGVGDVTGDGRKDVVVTHGGNTPSGRVTVFALLGEENLHTIPSGGRYEPHGLAVGDFSGDNVPDIAIADEELGLVVHYTDP